MENIDWTKCILCQKSKEEALKEPWKNINKSEITITYDNLVNTLDKSSLADALPGAFHPSLKGLIFQDKPSLLLHENKAKWHASCKLKVANSKIPKRKRKLESKETVKEGKETRSKVAKFDKNVCFIAGCVTKTTENEQLHEVMLVELDARFREYALIMQDKELLVKLAGGTLITLEAKYHSACAIMYYNRVKAKEREEQSNFRQFSKEDIVGVTRLRTK